MPRTRQLTLLGAALVALLVLALAGTRDDRPADAVAASPPGHVTYRVGDGPLLRVAAKPGAKPQDVTAVLDRRFPGGGDQFLNQSPDGRSLTLTSERFGCGGWPCLAVVSSDLKRGEAVLKGGAHPEGYSAVGNGGKVVVWPEQSTEGRIDLFASRKSGSRWTPKRNVTGKAAAPVHVHPAISSDGRRAVHDCGDAPDPSAGSLSICETELDGSGTRVRVRPQDGRAPQDPAFGAGSLHHPDYLAKGRGIVFEAQWCCEGESIWTQAKPGAAPRHVAGASSNNVAPCGLPDGRVLSLELSRSGAHELMITSLKGKRRTYLLPRGTDVLDAGLGCGR